MSNFLNELENIYNNLELVQEAIPIDTAKKIISKAGDSYKRWRDDIFHGKNRLVLNGTVDYNSTDIKQTDLMMLINGKIDEFKKFDKELQMDRFYPYKIESFDDYLKGICYALKDKEKKNPTKIGKILQSMGETELLNSFTNDPFRVGRGKKFKVIVSRHPYDVAGVSTDRSWTSCMDLGTERIVYKDKEFKKGVNADFIDVLIRNHAMVAYLVSETDVGKTGQLSITRPVARILIYPFESRFIPDDISYSDRKFYQENHIAYGYGIVYGQQGLKGFEEIVSDFVDDLNKNITEEDSFKQIEGIYYDGSRYTANFPTWEDPIDIAKKYKFKNITYNEETLADTGDGLIHDISLYINIERSCLNFPYEVESKDEDGYFDVDESILERVISDVLVNNSGCQAFEAMEFDHEIIQQVKMTDPERVMVRLKPFSMEKLMDAFESDPKIEETNGVYYALFASLDTLDNDLKILETDFESPLIHLQETLQQQIPEEIAEYEESGSKESFKDWVNEKYSNEGGLVNHVFDNL